MVPMLSVVRNQKFIIFFSALIIRLLLNIAFLGSCDLLLAIDLFKDVCINGFPYPQFVPYFPVMPLLLWLQGLIAAMTNIPTNFWMKFFPTVFDACSAVLIFEILKKRGIQKSFEVGLLYAFAPISLIVTSIHGQWDSLPLFFLAYSFYLRDFYQDSLMKYFLFGVSFALSFLLKPYTLLFIFFIFEPYKNVRQELGRIWNLIIWSIGFVGVEFLALFLLIKWYRFILLDVVLNPFFLYLNLVAIGFFFFYAIFLFYKNNFSTLFKNYLLKECIILLGLISCISVFCIIFKILGFNIIATADTVLRHFNSGASNFGVPFALNQQGFFFLIIKNRIWQVGFILFLAYNYYRSKINVFEAIAIGFTFIFIFSAYSGPYLLWAFPFLFLMDNVLLLGLYNLIAGVFILLTYTYPLSHPAVPYLMGLALAPLKCCIWLQLPILFLHSAFSWIIPLLGNIGVPLLCAYVCIVLLKKTVFNAQRIDTEKLVQLPLSATWPLVFIASLIGIFFVFYFTLNREVLTISNDFYNFYAFSTVEGRPCATYGGTFVLNIGYLFLTLIVGWTIAACYIHFSSEKV